MFIMIDGIDGSGKSTIMSTWKEVLQKTHTCFDITAFCKAEQRLPTLAEVGDVQVVFSAEPTHAWVGAAIRQELISKNASYATETIADAFSLDREILYTRLLIPLRTKSVHIIQDRGISTSLCYQSLGETGLPMNHIATLRGNALTLTHAPDYLVISDIPPETALKRLASRFEKDDNAKFEHQEFLTLARNQFLSEKYQSYFTDRGTAIHILNANVELDIMKQTAQSFLIQHIHA
jgi:thymidylate kinase